MSAAPWIATARCHPLARWRYENKVTQKQLATKAGVSYGTVSRLERGEPVELKTAKRILEVAEKWQHIIGG